MKFVNRLLAALLSLALIVIGTLLVIEVVTHWFSKKPALVHWHSWYSWAKRTSWTETSLRVVLIVIAVVGLILLLAQLKRAKVTRLVSDPKLGAADDIDTAYTRRGAAAAVQSAVTDIDGVRSAKVQVARRKVVVNAVTSARDKSVAQLLKDPISSAAAEKLATLQLKSTPSVSVRVSPRSR